jgi:hypothetical protein
MLIKQSFLAAEIFYLSNGIIFVLLAACWWRAGGAV